MAKTKEQKRKDRERESRSKVLRRREVIRKNNKEEKENARKEYDAQRMTNRLTGATIVGRPMPEESAIDQLQHNMDILRALEGEYVKQEEQMSQENRGGGIGASADVMFIPKVEEKKYYIAITNKDLVEEYLNDKGDFITNFDEKALFETKEETENKMLEFSDLECRICRTI